MALPARACGWIRANRTGTMRPISWAGFITTRKPALLRWALTKPLDRVMYTPLAPAKADFDLVRDLMIETGVLDKKIDFDVSKIIRTRDLPDSPTERRQGVRPFGAMEV
jgi:hypothetical protein